VLKVSKKYTVG